MEEKAPKVQLLNFRYELMQRGVLEPKDVGFVPDAYTCNQHLERENIYLKKEMENYKFAAKYVLVVVIGLHFLEIWMKKNLDMRL